MLHHNLILYSGHMYVKHTHEEYISFIYIMIVGFEARSDAGSVFLIWGGRAQRKTEQWTLHCLCQGIFFSFDCFLASGISVLGCVCLN